MLASVTIFAAFYAAIILFWNIAIVQHFGNAFAGLLADQVLALYLHVLPGSKPNYQRSGITNTSLRMTTTDTATQRTLDQFQLCGQCSRLGKGDGLKFLSNVFHVKIDSVVRHVLEEGYLLRRFPLGGPLEHY